MPTASATYAPSRRRARSRRPEGIVSRAGSAGGMAAGRVRWDRVGRVRWDRVGRIVMLLVLAALVYLYLSAGLRMLSTWHESQHTAARVAAMEAEHRSLVRQHNRLSSQSTLEEEARQLGMMRPGEQSYVVGELPGN